MSKLSEFNKREREREDMVEELNRGRREIDKNMKGMDGWADRIMAAILAPLKDSEVALLPRGHNISNKAQNNSVPLWGKI